MGKIMLIESENSFGFGIFKVIVFEETKIEEMITWCKNIFGPPSWFLPAATNGWSQEKNFFYFYNFLDAEKFLERFHTDYVKV